MTEPWRNPDSPDWWHEKFPHTYTEYSPIRDTIQITVYFWMGGKKVRFDFEHDATYFAALEGNADVQELLFRDIALQMALEFIDLGDLTTQPLIGYGHLIWDGKWEPDLTGP